MPLYATGGGLVRALRLAKNKNSSYFPVYSPKSSSLISALALAYLLERIAAAMKAWPEEEEIPHLRFFCDCSSKHRISIVGNTMVSFIEKTSKLVDVKKSYSK